MSLSEEEAYLRTAFLERVAHELRGPASIVQGSIEELEQALGDDLEKHRPLILMARRGIKRILRTADRLEQTGQLEDGTADFNRAPCDLCELVRYAITSAETLESRRKIVVTLDVPEVPLIWSLDARWMGMVLHELASNAIRHAKQRASVRVFLEEDTVRVVFVDDNDSGESFGPIRFLPPRQRRGMGLGLAIARDVVQAHHGRLDIEIRDGAGPEHGACVTVTLPREPSTAQKTPGQEPPVS